MIKNQLQRLFDSVPRLPDSLRQSFENPVQVDRLPTDSVTETEFPINSESPTATRRTIRNTLLAAAFFCLIRSIPEYFLPIPWAYDIWGMFASFAVCTIVACLIGWPKRFWHWMVYLAALPALVLYILYLRSLFALLLLAAVFTAIVADRYTKQTLYLGSTTPYPRDRARNIRSRWRSRFLGLRAIRGMELYLVLVLLLIVTPWIIDGIATEVNPYGGTYRLPATLATLGIVLLAPILVELLAAVLYNRRPLKLTTAWRAFKRSFTEWSCYNSKDIRAPGVLQSPVGNAKTRRRLLVATILLWAAAFNPLITYRYNLHDQLAVARAKTAHEAEIEKTQSKAAAEEQIRKLASGTPAKQRESAAHELLKSQAEIELWGGNLDEPPAQLSTLQPYQRRLIAELPAEKRGDYLLKTLGLKRTQSLADLRELHLDDSPEKEAEKPARFLLLSQLEHPYQRDLVNSDQDVGRLGFVFSFAIMFIAAREFVLMFLAFSFPIAFLYAASVRVAACLREQLEAHPDTILSFGNWNRLVDDVATSNEATESASILLGANKADGSPVIVPRSVFEEHAHILGDSGSGKTSMGVALILNQLVRQEDCSIVVLDLKGDDKALFRGTQLDAAAANKPFRWFTNELGKSSYGFNPLAQEYFQDLSLYQKTDVITAALGLQYGTDYGRGYYSDANADFLYRTLQQFPQAGSFSQLLQPLLNPPPGLASRETLKAATHLVSVIQRLASTEAMNLTGGGNYSSVLLDSQIDFADLFRKPQVAYFHLPSSLGATTSAEIARVALYSLIGSARQTPDADRKQVFVFIDEFQRILAGNLDMIMQTARSMKIGLILANQSLSDLKKQGVDLMSTVRTNTRFKQVFAASNVDDLKEIVELSGEALVHTRSYGEEAGILGAFAGGILKMNSAESTTPRLRVNDVLLATDAPDQSIVQVRRGAGFAQYGGFPFIMKGQFHISKEEYTKRKNSPWPPADSQTLLAAEVESSSLINQFDQVNPIAQSTAPNENTSSGTEALSKLFSDSEARLKKRERRRNAKKDNTASSSDDKDA